MTWSNWVELTVLTVSLIAVFFIVRISNRKVEDLDGLGEVSEKGDVKGNVVAHF